MNSIKLAQDSDQRRALVNTVIDLQIPQNMRTFRRSYTIVGLSRKAQLNGVIQGYQAIIICAYAINLLDLSNIHAANMKHSYYSYNVHDNRYSWFPISLSWTKI
jgi:hypothetical protein